MPDGASTPQLGIRRAVTVSAPATTLQSPTQVDRIFSYSQGDRFTGSEALSGTKSEPVNGARSLKGPAYPMPSSATRSIGSDKDLDSSPEVRMILMNVSAQVQRMQSYMEKNFQEMRANLQALQQPTIATLESLGALPNNAVASKPQASATGVDVEKLAKQTSDLLAEEFKTLKRTMAVEGEEMRDKLETLSDRVSELRQEMNSRSTSKLKRGQSFKSSSGKNDQEEAASELSLQEDPRTIIARFFSDGDGRGPMGQLNLNGVFPDSQLGHSRWFAVFRPTSSEAIKKMVFGHGGGKGLNVKGKSAKKGELSGFVPFLQISDNTHKKMLSTAPAKSHFKIFYQSLEGRDEAFDQLTQILVQMERFAAEAREQYESHRQGMCELSQEEIDECTEKMGMHIENARLEKLDHHEDVKGLLLPERLWLEAYVNRRDLTHPVGWETGRKSAPAFSNMNLHAIRDSMEAHERCQESLYPHVVVYQYDPEDPMNPCGLLLAYEEDTVKPVVSDFDGFLVGSSGRNYEVMQEDQLKLVRWCLDNVQQVLEKPGVHPWSTRWLQILKKAGEQGFHPDIPKYGFGDGSSYQLFADLVKATSSSGAVRHGAECFNFYFPQELDDEYMVIMEGIDKKPWKYLTEPQLRQFLLERISEGFAFPLNPSWPCVYPGWWEVWEALLKSPQAQQPLDSWFPPASGIREQMALIHSRFPEGFEVHKKDAAHLHEHHFDEKDHQDMKSMSHDIDHMGLDACEMADLGLHQMRRHQRITSAKRHLRIVLHAIALLTKTSKRR